MSKRTTGANTSSRAGMATTDEVAAYLKVKRHTLHTWRCYGKGPKVYRVGSLLRYRWSDVEQWLQDTNK